MALIFSLTTPLGMAIGIGVLQSFNGNDPTTIIVIGSFDAVSAGILIWIGVAEMLASDWIYDGPMGNAGLLQTCVALFGLVAGMALMSFLGRWA
ncbi:uncharacterized protein F5Z01DRAFT_343721 [Emericellopsis atlantica]|uniref:Uncharacterized protein n=1 Tax=Emericellopsis atlantica TaxID=2614577 RepID=A0A9P7ZEK3_9HYPO|nr:uncharacterized protein F5Z01DRAFT_343721 [Emericellopsis atlantica]KAG9250699.1 hypothetical protein F5Z01DRAFT_343721 [Emericellopsis atlantica]